MLLAEDHLIQPENLPETLTGIRPCVHPLDRLLETTSIKVGRQIVDQWLIERALETTGGNKSKAAELLEISYPSLLSKLQSMQDGTEKGEG
jgi:two-component system, NtrC family, response regulator AtoC